MVHLDTRITLEAIILNRLERIPSARRQEWLRGILVQGFRVECQALRATSDDATPGLVTGTYRFNPGRITAPVPIADLEPAVVEIMPSQVGTTEKPFAALGKVIG